MMTSADDQRRGERRNLVERLPLMASVLAEAIRYQTVHAEAGWERG